MTSPDRLATPTGPSFLDDIPDGDREAAGDREELVERVRHWLVAHEEEPTPARVAAALKAEGRIVGNAVIMEVLAELSSQISGAGPLEPLLRDPQVTDVLVNAPDEVWVDRGEGLHRVPIRFSGEIAVRRLAQRFAALAGRRLDDASPYVDVGMPNGRRLHAILPPIANRGTCLSFRTHRRQAFTVAELTATGFTPAAGAAWLHTMIKGRLAFLISGGAGTGKTTLLATLIGLVDPAERIVVVEDSNELAPDHPHVVRLEARQPNAEGTGEVTLRDLVRQALRMRPDRLVVGEVRGGEVIDLLTALNTGHEGSCGTVHANAAADVPARLEALGAMAALGRNALHSQLAAGIETVIHLVRDCDGQRRLAEIGVLTRQPAGLIDIVPALFLSRSGVVRQGPGHARLQALLARQGQNEPTEEGRGCR